MNITEEIYAIRRCIEFCSAGNYEHVTPVGWPAVESLDNRKGKIYQTGNIHTSMECLQGWNHSSQ